MTLDQLQAMLIATPAVGGFVAWTGRRSLMRHEWAIVRGAGDGSVAASGVEWTPERAQASAQAALCSVSPDRMGSALS